MRAPALMDRYKVLRDTLVAAFLEGDDTTYRGAAAELNGMLVHSRPPKNYLRGNKRTMMHGAVVGVALAVKKLGGVARLDHATNCVVVTVGNKYFYISDVYIRDHKSVVHIHAKAVVRQILAGKDEVMLDCWDTPMKVHTTLTQEKSDE